MLEPSWHSAGAFGPLLLGAGDEPVGFAPDLTLTPLALPGVPRAARCDLSLAVALSADAGGDEAGVLPAPPSSPTYRRGRAWYGARSASPAGCVPSSPVGCLCSCRANIP